MAYFFAAVVERINMKLASVEASVPSYPPKPLFFADVTSKTMCFPALTSFSTLEESTEAIAESVAKNTIGPFSPSFPPYKCSLNTKWCKYNGPKNRKKETSMDHRYYNGWNFAQDRPGIPCSLVLYSKYDFFSCLKSTRQTIWMDYFVGR